MNPNEKPPMDFNGKPPMDFNGKPPMDPNGKPPMKRPGDFNGPGRTHHVQRRDSYDMDIRSYSSSIKYLEDFDCWFLEDVVYCTNPLAVDLQCMNIYIPKAYLDDNMAVVSGAKFGKYTAETAPIVVQSAVMGYSEAPVTVLKKGARIPDLKAAEQLLADGCIYVSVGVRGRQTVGDDGSYVGKAPALLVDAKAAIRFYRHNSQFLPGNTQKIFFFGVSAGGNLAALVGATGDSDFFTSELQKIGAVMDESDEVFASQAYCPISDLSHANMAYEWMFYGRTELNAPPFAQVKETTLSPFRAALSANLAERYPEYINSLGLKDPATGESLTLNSGKHQGSLYNYIMAKLEDSATEYFEYLTNDPQAPGYSVEDYITGNYTVMERDREVQGTDKTSWLSFDGKRAHITSLSDMENQYLQRMKNCSAFDSIDFAEFENEEFGSSDTKLSHFDSNLADALEDLKAQFPDEYNKYAPAFDGISDSAVIKEQNFALNPINFASNNVKTIFRVRVGSADPHTSFTTAAIVSLALQNAGKNVDFRFTWEKGHGMCDYDGAMIKWIEELA
jgi:hypothetical protein